MNYEPARVILPENHRNVFTIWTMNQHMSLYQLHIIYDHVWYNAVTIVQLSVSINNWCEIESQGE